MINVYICFKNIFWFEFPFLPYCWARAITPNVNVTSCQMLIFLFTNMNQPTDFIDWKNKWGMTLFFIPMTINKKRLNRKQQKESFRQKKLVLYYIPILPMNIVFIMISHYLNRNVVFRTCSTENLVNPRRSSLCNSCYAELIS